MPNINQILSRIVNMQSQIVQRLSKTPVIGGTSELPSSVVKLDQNGKIPTEYLNDYTAFEVYASDIDITTATLASEIDERFIPIIFKKTKAELSIVELNSTPIKNNIIANKTHSMRINTSCDHGQNDIIIDWGDGTFLDLSDVYDNNTKNIINSEVLNFSKTTDGTIIYKVTHTYNNSGIYRINIYGRKYWRIDHEGCADNNLLCRVFTPDLPIASNFINLSSFCNTCRRLFDIDAAFYSNGLRKHIDNFSGTFTNCFNLKNVNWFPYTNYVVQGVPKIFYNCQNMTTINYTLPSHFGSSLQGIKSAFGWCKNLAVDIGTLFPPEKFQNKIIDVGQLFRRCAKLTGIVPADKLWNDKSITWLNTESAFEGCSNEIRAQVPESWGGTASDDIIEKSENEKIIDLQNNLNDLNNSLSSVISGLTEDISNISVDGIIPLKMLEISGNTIPLSNEYNCYKLTPSSALNLEFDNSNVSKFDGGEFYLMIDFTDGIQTINFPSTFTWKNNESKPTMNATKLYIFKCTYLYTDPIAYVGEFITSVDNIDYDSGMWVFVNDRSSSKVETIIAPKSRLQKDVPAFDNNGSTYGKIEFVVPIDFSYIDDNESGEFESDSDTYDYVPTYYSDYKIVINKGSVCTGIKANFDYCYFWDSYVANVGKVVLNGGEWYGGAGTNLTEENFSYVGGDFSPFIIEINDGYWDGTANTDWLGLGPYGQGITINGGIVESFYDHGNVDVNGGKIKKLYIGSADTSMLTIKGGEIDELGFYLYNDCSIENANIGIIKADDEYFQNCYYNRWGSGIIFIKNSTINTIESTLFGTIGSYINGKWVLTPTIIENCKINIWNLPLNVDIHNTNTATYNIINSKIGLLQLPSEEMINNYMNNTGMAGLEDFKIIINIDANSEVTIAKNMQNKSYIELVIEDGANITYLNN